MKASPNVWLVCGILAPVVYLAAVVLGGVLTPGYSHVAGPISALTMAGAPAEADLIPIFALYNALLASFAFTLSDAFRDRGVRIWLIAPVALVVVAIAGAAMLVYPMDPLGGPSTAAGRLHGFFAGIAALFTMVAVLFTWLGLRRYPAWRGMARYSLASLAAIAISGIWAALAAATLAPDLGLAERVTIGAFLQWVLMLAVALLRVRPASA